MDDSTFEPAAEALAPRGGDGPEGAGILEVQPLQPKILSLTYPLAY